jgi:hypothetical protein
MTTGVVAVLTPEPIVALFKNGLGAGLQICRFAGLQVHHSAQV